MYQDAGQFVNEPTQWYNIDVVTGVSELQGFLNPINNVNAIGYNLLDHYIYGYDQTVHRIVRIDNTGNLMQLSSNPTGLPNNDFNVGTFDLDGHLFLFGDDFHLRRNDTFTGCIHLCGVVHDSSS